MGKFLVEGTLVDERDDTGPHEYTIYTDYDVFYVDSILRGYMGKQIRLCIEEV